MFLLSFYLSCLHFDSKTKLQKVSRYILPRFSRVRLIDKTDFTEVITRSNETLEVLIASTKDLDESCFDNKEFISNTILWEDQFSLFDFNDLQAIEQVSHVLNRQRSKDIDVPKKI